MQNPDLLTINEAIEYTRSGKLPDNFKESVENFIEFAQCPNCDGRKDMNAVMRVWTDEVSPCPFCSERSY